MAEKKDSPGSSFLKWLAAIGTVLGFVALVVSVIAIFVKATGDPLTLRAISIAGFVLYLLGTLSFLLRARRASPFQRKAGLGALYVATAMYFFWVGSWTIPPASIDATSFPIEKASVTTYPFDGASDPKVGRSGYLATTSAILADNQVRTSYQFDYELPARGSGDAWAGFTLAFSEPQDLTEYSSVEMTVSFRDDQARSRFYVKDALNAQDFVILGDGRIVGAERKEQTIQIPLTRTYFPSVAKKLTSALVFDVHNEFTEGKHSFTVSSIRFRK